MSFDLRIHFLGLAMFVPEGTEKMHVLLPDTTGHDEHIARIIHDEAYETAGQTQLSRKYNMIKLEGRVLDLTGLTTSPGIDPNLPDELPDMNRVAIPVPATKVTGMPGGGVIGRVTMDAGALTDYGLGAAFRLNSPTVKSRMAVRTEWTVRGINSTSLNASLLGGGTALPELFPIAQTIHLMVFHTVRIEFPPHGSDFDIPEPGKDAEHFKAYYKICTSKDDPVEHFPKVAPRIPVQVKGDTVSKDGSESPGMTCVQPKATLGS
jgi:hypothetical protein